MSPLFRKSRGPSRRRISRRSLAVGTGSVLVGAMVLGAASSSAHSTALDPVAEQQPTVIAPAFEIAPGTATALSGFAPPALTNITTGTGVAPQFRTTVDLPSGPLGIPGVVLKAYKLAATRVGSESPQCKLPWFLLAGIGRIESNHAGNGSVDAYGTTINPIAGPVLDGTLAGNQVIRDTDGGRIDGDAGHDRAMGPMQFIPSTWASWGADANGDGKADPNNVFDATYSAGRYLCAGVTDIMNERNKIAAVLRYNHSMEYVANVLSWAVAYSTGVMPTNPIPEPKRPTSSTSSSKKRKPGHSRDRSASESRKPGDPSVPSTAPSTSTTPTQQCVVRGVCLPPGITIPGLPIPGQQQKKTPVPGRPSVTTTTISPAPKAPGARQPERPGTTGSPKRSAVRQQSVPEKTVASQRAGAPKNRHVSRWDVSDSRNTR